jgi:V/A-type H+/Na+-transporting ATPase subunit K
MPSYQETLMLWIAAFMTLTVLLTIGAGIYLQWQPVSPGQALQRKLKGLYGFNVFAFIASIASLLLISLSAIAAPESAPVVREYSVGLGLAFIGIGLPTALAAIAAGMAVSSVGSAALAVIAEKPEAFGRSLIFIGLAEGIAIYGLVISILMLDKI